MVKDMETTRQPFPGGMLVAGRIVHRLLSLGLPMGPLQILQTRGRHTGQLREVPVAVLRAGSQRWLVSPFGAVAWVHNVRATGHAHLRRGSRVEDIHLEEVHGDRVPEVLRIYRSRFAAVPFVRAAFDATGSSPLDAFGREAHDHPVFLVEPA